MVDPEPVDRAVAEQREQQRVGRREDHRVLDPDGHQRGHVEEAPVVQALRRLAPARQPVGLAVEQLGERQVLGARADRELVTVVPDHPLPPGRPAVGGKHDVAVLDRRLDIPPEHRHEDPVVLDVPVHVEPRRERRLPALSQQRPQRRVEVRRLRHRHVIRHHVDDDPQPMLAAHPHQLVERSVPARLSMDARVVQDVIAVG